MSENKKSIDYSNKQLSEFPKEIYNYKATLINLDISANPLLNLDETIKALKEFPSLKKLKINIETGDEAKKIIEALPNLIILNDHPIHEEEEDDIEIDTNNDNNEIIDKNKDTNNINNNLIKQEIAQLNYSSINASNEENNGNNNIKNIKNIINCSNNIKINPNNNIIDEIDTIINKNNNNNNINSNENNITNNLIDKTHNLKNNNNNNIFNNTEEKKNEIDEEKKFEYILNKIKEYSEITKEKYDLIIKEYNNLMNNNIKNTLDICSFFNKVLINLIKDAQEKSNIKISSLKPLLEAQSQNENIRINFEEKIHLALKNNKNNYSNISIDSVRNKNNLIKTETNSIYHENNITNINSNNNNISHNNSNNYTNHSNYKKRMEKNNSNFSHKMVNKNEIRKQYSKNIKNLSLSKAKKKDNSETEKIEKIPEKNKNFTFSIEDYLSDKNNNIKNKSHNKKILNDINITNINKLNNNEKPKKKFKFTQKSHSKKKISNKASFQQENIDTYSNTYTNLNTDINNKLNVSQPNALILNNTNTSFNPTSIPKEGNQHTLKNKIIEKNYSYTKKNYNSNDVSKNVMKTISTISNDNYLTKYDLLKNCQDNPTINSILLQIENNTNFEISNLFDGLKDIVNYDYNNIHIINLKNLLDIINQVYKLRSNRVKKQIMGSTTKGTLETDLMDFLKSRYGLKKLIIEWYINILSSIKAYSKIYGEVCLFGLILRNELDEGSIDILFKIKETIDSILTPLYQYDIDIINNIKNNKEFMNENEWLIIAEILYNNDNNLRQRFQNKIYGFIRKFIKNEKILEKSGKKILFGDFLNQLIMFNLRLRKKYLNNLVQFFKKQDKNRYGVINYDEFKLMMEDIGVIEKDKFKEVTDCLIESADKEGIGQITFNDIVICFDNFYLDNLNNNKNDDKIKLLDQINNLNLN